MVSASLEKKIFTTYFIKSMSQNFSMTYLKRSLAFASLFLLCAIRLFAQNAVISGSVNESASGEVVIGVNVILSKEEKITAASTVRGARTNKFGFYSLPNIAPGTYFLEVRGIGYKTYKKQVTIAKPDESIRLNIGLTVQSAKSGEVTVSAERQEINSTKTISTVAISSDFIKKMPAILGEADVFRTLQFLPGIKAGNELSSGLYVRGGSPDQNLILLDGVTVYNPSHLFGFFSTFNADAIQDVRVIKGAFPAEYGSRLSSVVDMTMREGTKEKFSGTGNVSLIAARLTVEGPITEDVTFMVSGRRTYFDLPLAVANLVNPPGAGAPGFGYYFYDLNAKLNYKISDNDRLFLSGYFGRDDLTLGIGADASFGINWGNATGNLRWTHIVSPSLFTNFSAIFTDYAYRQDIDFGNDFAFNTFSNVRDFTVRGEAQWFPAPEHTIKTGIEGTFHRFQTALGTSGTSAFEQFLRNSGNAAVQESIEGGAYIQDEWQISPILSTNLGFRLSYFSRGNRWLPEPRASVSLQVAEDVAVKGAFAVANQFLHLLVLNGFSLPNDTWFPATETINPASGVQYVLGVETQLFDKEYLFSVEGYYKSLRNLLEFRDDVQLTAIGAPREDQLTSGNGQAYGVELFLNKRMGALTGWIGYTLSWTERTFADLNGGKMFYPRYDRRHDISIVAQYQFNDSWDFGATWTFATGQAFTMPAAQFDFSGVGSTPTSGFRTPRTLYTERNGFRLPDYHRLDVSATYKWTGFGLPWNLTLSVYNAYNRQNPFTWFVNYGSTAETRLIPDATRPSIPRVQQITVFGILPNISIGVRF